MNFEEIYSTYELTGINVHSDVDFLGGKKSDWATYLIKDNEKFEESRIIESFEIEYKK